MRSNSLLAFLLICLSAIHPVTRCPVGPHADAVNVMNIKRLEMNSFFINIFCWGHGDRCVSACPAETMKPVYNLQPFLVKSLLNELGYILHNVCSSTWYLARLAVSGQHTVNSKVCQGPDAIP